MAGGGGVGTHSSDVQWRETVAAELQRCLSAGSAGQSGPPRLQQPAQLCTQSPAQW